MHVCLILEGAYPYVAGGVSSWTHQLINRMEDINFTVLSIMASRYEEIEYKYEIPRNVVEIKTIYLDDFFDLEPIRPKHEPEMDYNQELELNKFIRFDRNTEWDVIGNFMRDKEKFGDAVQFLQSKTFWDMMNGLYNEKFEIQGFNKFFWTIRSMLAPLINVIQDEFPRADIYHAISTGYAGLMGVIAKVVTKKPFVLTEHGIYSREREEEIIKAQWVQGIYKRIWIDFFYFTSIGAYKKADRIIALFERNREIQIQLGAEEYRCKVIANGVDIDRFKIEYEEHEGFNVGAILRIVPIKDVKTLLRAFKVVSDRFPDSKLYLMGPFDEDPHYYEECLKMINFLKLNNKVDMTGRVNVWEYIPIMDVLVLTSISEGQPLVILEGMASGVPFVSTDVGSCKELLYGKEGDKLGKCGTITMPVSPLETAKEIIKILVDKELRREMGRVGRKRVEKYYTVDDFIKKYREIYEELE